MSRTALALRHLAFEDLGLIEPLLRARGFEVVYGEVPTQPLDADAILSADLLVVLGGPIGANEEEDYPFLTAETALIRRRLDAARPTLGICLGAQLIARALGEDVHPAREKEIGWGGLMLTEAGRRSCLGALGEAPQVLHWHGDTFSLPDQAVLLASTDKVRHQAFSIRDHVLALQFHLEVPAPAIEAWLVGHTAELRQAGISPRGLRDQTRALAEDQAARAIAVFTRWFDQAGL